jgi:hypothetical protein
VQVKSPSYLSIMDIRLDVGGRGRTGYDVLLWMEQEIGTGRATFELD